jgi:AMP-polyphosphate phosphotransferase
MLDKIDLNQKVTKGIYKQVKSELYQRLNLAQIKTFTSNIPIIILLEGWYAASTGNILRNLTKPLDPRGFRIISDRKTSSADKKFPWLRKYWINLPARGEWVIFDGSWYQRVSYERVQKIIPEKEWRRSYRDIVEFEHTLSDDGYMLCKFFLHINKQEQKRRHFKCLKDPKTTKQHIDEIWEQQQDFDNWMSAYTEIFERTDTEWGAWKIIEATKNRFVIIKLLGEIILSLENRLQLPYTPLPELEKPPKSLDPEVDLLETSNVNYVEATSKEIHEQPPDSEEKEIMFTEDDLTNENQETSDHSEG